MNTRVRRKMGQNVFICFGRTVCLHILSCQRVGGNVNFYVGNADTELI